MILRTRKPLLPTGPTKRQTVQRSPAQACFTRMLILQRRKWSLQKTQNSQVVLSGPLLPSASSALPWPHPLTPCFLSRPILSPPPSSLCGFLWWDVFPLCCVLKRSSNDPCPLQAPPPTLCLLWDCGSRGGLFAVHTFVSTSGGWSKCSGDICRVDKRQRIHCGSLSLLDWALLAFLIFQRFFRVML